MAWEDIKKKKWGGWHGAPAWREVPCISLTRTSISLNAKFAEVWLQDKTHMLVCVDVEGQRLGFKPLAHGEETSEAFKILRPDNRENGRELCVIGCKRPSRLFAEMVGRQFRARLNESNGIIEVDLSPRNFA